MPDHWRFGQLYKNAEDPALFVPTRDGVALDAQLRPARRGRPAGVVLGLGVLGPAVILVLALRCNFDGHRSGRNLSDQGSSISSVLSRDT